MEALTRLVTDSLARHGFDRPIDPRRLQWSRWFRCESPHSLLIVPSRPGIFAIAEEITEFGSVGTATLVYPELSRRGHPERSSAGAPLGGAALQRCGSSPLKDSALAAEAAPTKRMLAVLRFSEDDDMAFTLDRMFTRINPMRALLSSGNCFLRFVVIEDQDERRSICSALNQWMLSSAEKAIGIPAAFSSSMELAPVGDRVGTARVGAIKSLEHIAGDSETNQDFHCPHPLPGGF